MKCELDWFIQWRAQDRGRRLIASVGRVYYRPRRGVGSHNAGESDIYERLVIVAILLLYYKLMILTHQ